MSDRIWCFVIGFYAMTGLITFGHAAAAAERVSEQSAAMCRAKGQSRYCDGAIEAPPLNGMAAAVLWPLYWSWELQA